MITVDRREWDVDEIVRTEILPYVTTAGLLGAALAGAVAGRVVESVSVSPLFAMRREVARAEIKRQRQIEGDEEI